MAIKKIEIQDSDGNIYYPHTSADVVLTKDGKTVETSLDEVKTVAGDKSNLKTNDKTNLVNAVNELFQYANDIKNKWNNVLGTNLTSTNSSEEYKNHTQWCKNKLVGNLGQKGVVANSSDSLSNLVDKVSSIFNGRKFAHGKVLYSEVGDGNAIDDGRRSSLACDMIKVRGLDFPPSDVIIFTTFREPTVYVASKELLGNEKHYALRNLYKILDNDGLFLNDGFNMMVGIKGDSLRYRIDYDWIAFS